MQPGGQQHELRHLLQLLQRLPVLLLPRQRRCQQQAQPQGREGAPGIRGAQQQGAGAGDSGAGTAWAPCGRCTPPGLLRPLGSLPVLLLLLLLLLLLPLLLLLLPLLLPLLPPLLLQRWRRQGRWQRQGHRSEPAATRLLGGCCCDIRPPASAVLGGRVVRTGLHVA